VSKLGQGIDSMNTNLQQIMWVAHPIMELALVGIMVWRKLHRTFPVFFAYVVFQVLNFVILFPIYRSGNTLAYFWAYWISAAISLAIVFKVIHEIFLDVFRPYHTLKDLGTVLFKWAALVMLLVAMVVTAASQSGGDAPLTQAVIIGQRCIRVVQCGLILFLLVFSNYLGVSWRQHSFGIALGLGSFATIDLISLALFSGRQIQPPTLSLINTTAYSLSILTWIIYAVVKSAAREPAANLMMSQRWDQSLGDLRNPATGDALIPMFESMVDRAFSRTPGEDKRTEVEERVALRKITVSEKGTFPAPARVTPKNLVR
jgi:hypothetical protein